MLPHAWWNFVPCKTDLSQPLQHLTKHRQTTTTMLRTTRSLQRFGDRVSVVACRQLQQTRRWYSQDSDKIEIAKTEEVVEDQIVPDVDPSLSPRLLHPFLLIHDASKFATDFLTVEGSGKREFEDREKFRVSAVVSSTQGLRTKVSDLKDRVVSVDKVEAHFAANKGDALSQLYSQAKTASLPELKKLCNSVDSNAVLGDQYGTLANYKKLRKGRALAVVAQEIIFRYQKLTEEAGEILDTEPLFHLVGYVYTVATEDVRYTTQAADALFWTVCKSGNLEDITTVATMMGGMQSRPSDQTVSEALAPALRPLTKIRDVDEKTAEVIGLFPLRPTFTTDVPAKLAPVLFGLCSRLDEFVSAFNIVRHMKPKASRDEVFAESASAMLKAVVRCTKNEVSARGPEQDELFFRFEVNQPSQAAMANMFAVARFLRLTGQQEFPQKAVETALLQCAREGNVAGLNRVMTWTDKVSKRTTERVLELFPFSQGMADEPLIPSIGISSMLQGVTYEGHVQFLESLKQATEAKELVAEIEAQLKSID